MNKCQQLEVKLKDSSIRGEHRLAEEDAVRSVSSPRSVQSHVTYEITGRTRCLCSYRQRLQRN